MRWDLALPRFKFCYKLLRRLQTAIRVARFGRAHSFHIGNCTFDFREINSPAGFHQVRRELLDEPNLFPRAKESGVFQYLSIFGCSHEKMLPHPRSKREVNPTNCVDRCAWYQTATRLRRPAQGCRFGYPGWGVVLRSQPQRGCAVF